MPFPRTYFRKAPEKPRLALSLQRLAEEVDRRWPNRGTASDGWIGDRAHQGRISDHNPDRWGIVRALDVTAAGIRPRQLVTAALNHPSVAYVIWNRKIWSRSTKYRPRRYQGEDPHTSHVHISIRADDHSSSSLQEWRL